jgi:hypothetical protein
MVMSYFSTIAAIFLRLSGGMTIAVGLCTVG